MGTEMDQSDQDQEKVEEKQACLGAELVLRVCEAAGGFSVGSPSDAEPWFQAQVFFCAETAPWKMIHRKS